MSDFSNASSQQNDYTYDSHETKKTKNYFKNNKYLPLIVVLVLFIILGTLAIRNTMQSNASPSAILGSSGKVEIEGPIAEQKLNKTLIFPLRDAQGKKVSDLKYEIQSAELRNEILVKGQKATAVEGRTFLVLNLKITNNFDKSIQLNSKDYIRLTTGNSPEKLAADIHNDPVEVQAISTKYTRLGFPINKNNSSLTLQVGEISGPKETIKLNLR